MNESIITLALAAMLAGLAIDEALELSPYHLRNNGNLALASVSTALALAESYGIDPIAASQPSPSSTAEAEAASAQAAIDQAKRAELYRDGIRFFDPATHQTWTGKGQVPAWLKAATADGTPRSHFALADPQGQRCPNTAELIGAEG